ncbi:MAG: DEAD/DEAH box helicase family protein [Verrucomicrobia bacterium]|nr:DEAD/DEAH box helicase family protein [Verrucomicrobiota bacterium]
MVNFNPAIPSITLPNNDGSALIDAIERDAPLSEIEALINHETINSVVNYKSALAVAVQKGNATLVRLLTKNGANPEITGNPGIAGNKWYTCYHLALENPNAAAILSVLATKGIDTPDQRCSVVGRTPFQQACLNKNLEAAMTLLNMGAKPDPIAAAKSGMLELIEQLFPKKTLLLTLFQYQAWDAAKKYLERDDPVLKSDFERAIYRDCPDFILTLLCEKLPNYKQQAFYITCQIGNVERAKWLYANGCTVDEKAWHLATAHFKINIFEWIASIRPELVNTKDANGKTALYKSIKDLNLEAATSLVTKCGASVDPESLALVNNRSGIKRKGMYELITKAPGATIAPSIGPTTEIVFGYSLHPPADSRDPKTLIDEALSLWGQTGKIEQRKIIANAIRLLDDYHHTILDGTKADKTLKILNSLAQSLLSHSQSAFAELSEERIKQWRASFPYDPGFTYEIRPKHPEKQKLGLIRLEDSLKGHVVGKDYTETRSLRELYKLHKHIQKNGFSGISSLINPHFINNLYLQLKYLAKYYGLDPDSETIGGAYAIVEMCVKNSTSLPKDLQLRFEDDGSTDIFGGIMRTPQLLGQTVSPDTSWIEKPWSELSDLQKRHLTDVYKRGVEEAQRATNPTDGQKRLLDEYARYRALQTSKPFDATVNALFTTLLKEQWEHLVKNPERIEKLLYTEPTETSCPLLLLTEVSQQPYAWVTGHTAHLINGYTVAVEAKPHPQLHTLVQGKKKLTANELQALITKLHSEKIPCVVLAQKGTFTYSSTSTNSTTGLTHHQKTAKASTRELKEKTGEPKPKVAKTGNSSSEEKTEKTKSSTVELLMQPETFDTGDFLQDMALHLLENARFTLSKRAQKEALYAGESWKEVALATKVEKLPRKPKKSQAILAAKLKPYQQHAVNWIREWCDAGIAGLLAADAGLGKTLTALELIFQELSKFQDEENKRTVLVLCKKSLVAQWESSFKKELEEAKNALQQKLALEPIETWIARLESIDLNRSLRSSNNQKLVLDAISELKSTKDYAILYQLLYTLVQHAGAEGRATLIEFLNPLTHIDQRQVFLAAQFFRAQVVAKAETANDLQAVLKTKPRVVITTPSALNKQADSQEMKFSWVIIDEADQITEGIEDLQKILDGWRQKNEQQKRLLITATPVRNSITDVWELFGLVNGKGAETQEYINQMLVLKDAFMKGFRRVTEDKSVDEEELFSVACRLHQRIRYLREIIAPITYTARRTDAAIIEQWQGRIPTIERKIIPITLNDAQNSLIEEAKKMRDIFTRYQFEAKLKLHPDFIAKGASKLIEKKSTEYGIIAMQARNDPDALIARSPLWQALFDDLTKRMNQNEKCVIVCHHIIPQELLKLAIAKKFEAQHVLVESINGDTTEDIGSILNRFKSEKKRPSVMLLINKSGGAGLDFPDATTTYMLGEEWNDAAKEQIEARIVRVGVEGVKQIVYFNAGLLHEKHMSETSKMKNLWAKLALAKAPAYKEYAKDIEEMLLALQSEFTATVQDGKQLQPEQVEKLGQFVEVMAEKAWQEVRSIYKAYALCRPNSIQPHPYHISIDGQNIGLEIPLRASFQEAIRFGALILSKKMFPEQFTKALASAEKNEEPCDIAPILAWYDRHEAEIKKPEELGAEVLIFSPDGNHKPGFKPQKKQVTLRLLELPNGKFSPLLKNYVGK